MIKLSSEPTQSSSKLWKKFRLSHFHQYIISCLFCLVNPCSSNPCLNGGQCISGTDFLGYVCACLPTHTGFTCEIEGMVINLFLYSACFFLHQLGISLVYWLNLFKTHCVLFASTCTAEAGLSNILLSTAFWVGVCAKHTCDLCVFQNMQCAQGRRMHTSE